MAERVTLWRSSDGKTFDTEEAAEIYENETRIFNECMKIVASSDTRIDWEDMEKLCRALAGFVMNERAERDHYWSVTNNDD